MRRAHGDGDATPSEPGHDVGTSGVGLEGEPLGLGVELSDQRLHFRLGHAARGRPGPQTLELPGDVALSAGGVLEVLLAVVHHVVSRAVPRGGVDA